MCPFLRSAGWVSGGPGEGSAGRGGVWACSLSGGRAWGRGRAGRGPLLFSLTRFLGFLISSLCGSGDRDDP